jgi:uncharacterized repeat protein (TIGR02059 family)
MNLSDNGLTSSIPSELAQLTALTSLNLSCNQLTGDIPSTLGDLQNLRSLRVFGNNLNEPSGADRAKLVDQHFQFEFSSDSSCPRVQPGASPPSNDNVPPSLEMAELSSDGMQIDLTYDEALDSANGPSTLDFTVKVDGQAVRVSTVYVQGRTVNMNLATPVREYKVVSVTYEDSTAGNDARAIQDRSGNDAADLIDW